jgi:ADP-ribosylglycohydrolase
MSGRDAALRALQGLQVGDGFGERFFRFEPVPVTLASIEARELPPGPWRWTDDTAQAAVLTHHLVSRGTIEQDVLAAELAAEYQRDPRRGYGAGAHDMLRGILSGEDWRAVASAAFGGSGSMGNGAAMRVAPLGAWFGGALDEAAQQARRSAEVTHANVNGVAGAIAVAVAASAVAAGLSTRVLLPEVLARTPGSFTRAQIEVAAGLPPETSVKEAAQRLGTGAQVCAHDTVPFCLWVITRYRSSYEAALWATVSGLGDRDTTCAIVGGILASGADVRIPEAWLARAEPLS